ncbi:MAG: hypothetical protein ACXW4B_02180 [Micavibrio sp.]
MSLKSGACDISSDTRFVPLGQARRIWAISAIHADADRLITLHDQLFDEIQPGDRIVYLGNYVGYGASPRETLDEILTFRRIALSLPGMMPDDFIYLRGGQDEMWEKLQQLQFAPNPKDVLNWMLDNGMSSTLEAYGIKPRSGLMAAIEGVMSLTRWTASVRSAIRKNAGHDIFQCQLRRAAFTPLRNDNPILFVHAGINPERMLQDQGDALWWGGQHFNKMNQPYAPFKKVIRGFDPKHEGLHINGVTATIDGGCGFGGNLVCAGFDADGEVIGVIEA